MAVDPARLVELRVAASKLSLAERGPFLDRECGSNVELRVRVEALLREDDAAGSTAADPDRTGVFTPEPEDATDSAIDDGPEGLAGAVIAGRYALVEIIGEGGMGEVWVANQSEPVKRRVAVKLIKAGMDTRAVL